jgi:prevent-host-death family protein
MVKAMTKQLSITEAKNKLTQLVREVEEGAEVTITKDRRPAAVLLSWEAYALLKRQIAAARLRELRDELVGSDLSAEEIYRESRKQLEERSS